MTDEKDIVLIYLENTPICFARVEQILPDVKKDWYHVKLLLLQIPLQVVTWILRDAYINGEEFTMNEKRMRLVQVESPEPDESEPEEKREPPKISSNGTKIISFPGKRKT